MPPVRVAMAKPVSKPTTAVARPGRQDLPRHHHDGERRPRHRGQKGDVDRREEQAAVEITRHQAERDGGETGPAADRKPSERQERCHAGKADQERHDMSDRDPVGKIKRLEIGREHVKPRPVVPKRKFDGLEVRAVLEAARVPGERLGAVVVGVELINGQPIVRPPSRSPTASTALSRKAAAIISASIAKRGAPFLPRATALWTIGISVLSMTGLSTSNPPIGADQANDKRGARARSVSPLHVCPGSYAAMPAGP